MGNKVLYNPTDDMNMPEREKKKLFIVVADDKYFLSHRLEIGKAAVKAGWDVTIVAGRNGGEDEIRRAGMNYVALPPIAECGTLKFQILSFCKLLMLFRRNRNAVFHIVGLSMLPIGNVAAGIAGGYRGLVNAVCGLGSMFGNPDSFKARMLMRVLRMVWQRENKKHKVTTIVQNHDDEALLLQQRVITGNEIVYIKGSGVDLDRFRLADTSSTSDKGKVRIIFTGRLLKSKGVEDLIKAAEILRPEWEDKIEFMICGDAHHNPESLSVEEMTRLCDGHYIIMAGQRNDLPELLAGSRIMVFPSYYREGVPLSLIEASAAGLPIITCDSVGCRDTIEDNGYLVRPKNPVELAHRIEELLRDDEKCSRFGKQSRRIAERDYDLKKVVDRHLRIYDSMMND